MTLTINLPDVPGIVTSISQTDYIPFFQALLILLGCTAFVTGVLAYRMDKYTAIMMMAIGIIIGVSMTIILLSEFGVITFVWGI
jgi:hypothetical protein